MPKRTFEECFQQHINNQMPERARLKTVSCAAATAFFQRTFSVDAMGQSCTAIHLTETERTPCIEALTAAVRYVDQTIALDNRTR
jgi:hypothetical protein